MQGGLIPFEIGVSVVGDVTVAVWIGDHNMGERIHTKPSFAYAFHTGEQVKSALQSLLPC